MSQHFRQIGGDDLGDARIAILGDAPMEPGSDYSCKYAWLKWKDQYVVRYSREANELMFIDDEAVELFDKAVDQLLADREENKQLQRDDAAIIYKAPKRGASRVFYIDTGMKVPPLGEAYLNELKEEMRKRQVVKRVGTNG